MGNYWKKTQVRIWKRNIPLLIDLLISNNFSFMTFFCATRILWVIIRQSIVYIYITIRKGRFLLVNDQGFSLISAKEFFFPRIKKKKKKYFTPPEIWLKPKSCLCSIYHNFVKNYSFDLKFAVFLVITFHYNVLFGLFDNMICVVVVLLLVDHDVTLLLLISY